MESRKKVLLLGAGFTANFGAPVASQVWNDLFNYPALQRNFRLRSVLKSHYEKSDFEGYFSEVVHNVGFTNEEKKIVVTAVIEIYERINSYTERLMIHDNSSGVCFEKLICFLKKFSNLEHGKGFIFTLNQDLFLEKLVNKYLRKNSVFSDLLIAYPAINVPYINDDWKSELPSRELLDNWLIKPNCGGSLNAERTFPFYVKLHGSSGWTNRNNEISYPVIGKNKSYQISQEPLLKWYMELFENNLSESIDICIIGYSFSDNHINEVIMKSMQNNQSSLYVVDTKTYVDFMKHILAFDCKLHDLIDKHLFGYFPCSLKQIFPSEDLLNLSYYGKSINRIFDEKT